MSAVRVTAIVLLALVLAACGGDQDAQPSADGDRPALAPLVEERLAAESELRERIEALEAALEGAPSADGSLERRLDELDEALRVLDARFTAEQTERIEIGTRLDEAERDLRASVADVRDALERLRGQLQDLEIRYEVLQERIDRMQS
jgi:chromosome segregation ATPase